MKNRILIKACLLAFGMTLFQLSAQDRTVTFNVSGDGDSKPIIWGLDLAWRSESNFRRGYAFMGSDQVDIVRVSYFPTAALVNNDYQGTALESFNWRMTMLDTYAREDTKIALNSNAPTIDPYFTDGNGQIVAARWAEVIDVTARKVQENGYTVISAGPFNEPDFGYVGRATRQTFLDVATELKAKERFNSIRINGGNTLSTNAAHSWYDFIESQLDEGCTHQLAGNFNNYASFFQKVRENNHYGLNDELHNVMEAIVGSEYGMQTGIWWGEGNYVRGELVKATDGVRLGYAEHRTNWTAAAVYRTPNGKVQAFLGGSERQAATTIYKFVSEDQEVFFDGYGPQREYIVTYPGGVPGSYQNGQTNAEKVINITWGEDVQPVIDGRYKLVNRHSGMVAEVAGGATADGTNVQQNNDIGASYQQWDVQPVNSRIGGDFSYFTLTDVNSGNILDLSESSLEDGGNVDVGANDGAKNRQWYLEYAEDGWFYIRSRYSSQCLDVSEEGDFAGANIYQSPIANDASQQWRLLPAAAPIEYDSPTPPGNLAGTSNTSPIHLTWEASTSLDVAGYTIFRSEGDGAYNTIARNVTNTFYDDHTAEPGKAYYYKINAIDHSLNRSVDTSEVGPLLDSGAEEVWLEAECGSVGALWDTPIDGNAANSQYVTIRSGNNSTGSAPEGADGHIVYDFDLATGTYKLWARVITPSNTDDSFWVKMDDGEWVIWNDIGTNNSWEWLEMDSYSLENGGHTLTIAYREDGARLDKLYIGNSIPSGRGAAISNCSSTNSIWMEAECGNVGSLWNMPTDEEASNDQYVTIQPGNNSTGSAPEDATGHISFDFDASYGIYSLWARVITPVNTDDSFWIKMDDGEWLLWNDLGTNNNWIWLEVQGYVLTNGSHTLTIAYREDGALLDKLYLGNLTPTNEGETADNCDSNDVALIQVRKTEDKNRSQVLVENQPDVWIHPNPVEGNALNLSGYLVENQQVEVTILDMLGRAVSVEEIGVIRAGKFDKTVSIGGLKPGAYLIKINMGSETETRSFIKN